MLYENTGSYAGMIKEIQKERYNPAYSNMTAHPAHIYQLFFNIKMVFDDFASGGRKITIEERQDIHNFLNEIYIQLNLPEHIGRNYKKAFEETDLIDDFIDTANMVSKGSYLVTRLEEWKENHKKPPVNDFTHNR